MRLLNGAKRAALLALIAAASCANLDPSRCVASGADTARQLGATALHLEDPNGPNVHVEDRGRNWLVGEWIEDLDTDDEVVLGFGGRSVEIDKCSGRAANLRSWR